MCGGRTEKGGVITGKNEAGKAKGVQVLWAPWVT